MYIKIKHLLDFIVTFLGLIVLAPLLLIVMLILRFTGESEIFYLQERVGLDQKIFKMFKFATMLKDSPSMGSKNVTLRGDPRITFVGRYLRISKINELPQLFNVILGDMSLVGPRPLPLESFNKYDAAPRAAISKVRPGVTGIGSLIFRDEEKLVTEAAQRGIEPLVYYQKFIYPYKGQIECWYQENISLRTDFGILFFTFWNIFFPDSKLFLIYFKTLPALPTEFAVNDMNAHE